MATIDAIKIRRAKLFARLEACAVAGDRCPTREQGVNGADISYLANAGKLSVEISTHNWRRITIMHGPHAGKSTAPNPLRKSSVYMTIDASGTRGSGGRLVDTGKSTRAQPSKPGLIPYAGKR